MKKVILTIAAALMLSACKPHIIPSQKSAPFEIGKTTLKQVIDTLGQPAGLTRNPDGSQAINYFHSTFKAKADSDIPNIGGFSRSNEVESSSVSMQFDKNGILRQYSAMFGKTSYGLAPDTSP